MRTSSHKHMHLKPHLTTSLQRWMRMCNRIDSRATVFNSVQRLSCTSSKAFHPLMTAYCWLPWNRSTQTCALAKIQQSDSRKTRYVPFTRGNVSIGRYCILFYFFSVVFNLWYNVLQIGSISNENIANFVCDSEKWVKRGKFITKWCWRIVRKSIGLMHLHTVTEYWQIWAKHRNMERV